MPAFHRDVCLVDDNQYPVALNIRDNDLIQESVGCTHVTVGALDDNDRHVDKPKGLPVAVVGLAQEVDHFLLMDLVYIHAVAKARRIPDPKELVEVIPGGLHGLRVYSASHLGYRLLEEGVYGR